MPQPSSIQEHARLIARELSKAETDVSMLTGLVTEPTPGRGLYKLVELSLEQTKDELETFLERIKGAGNV